MSEPIDIYAPLSDEDYASYFESNNVRQYPDHCDLKQMSSADLMALRAFCLRGADEEWSHMDKNEEVTEEVICQELYRRIKLIAERYGEAGGQLDSVVHALEKITEGEPNERTGNQVPVARADNKTSGVRDS